MLPHNYGVTLDILRITYENLTTPIVTRNGKYSRPTLSPAQIAYELQATLSAIGYAENIPYETQQIALDDFISALTLSE